MNQDNHKITKLITEIIKYAIPISATNLLGVAAILFATLILARMGQSQLAALSIANSCTMTISACAGSCLFAITILISKYHTSNNKHMVTAVLYNGLYFSIILQCLWSCVCLLVSVTQKE